MATLAGVSPVPISSYTLETRRAATSRAALKSNLNRAHHRHVSPERDLDRSYSRPSDSSDDEDLAPIKLSAEAQAILDQENSQAGSDKENADQRRGEPGYVQSKRSSERYSPHQSDGSPARRVVRLPGTSRVSPPAVLERDGSFAYKVLDRSKQRDGVDPDSRTPATRLRRIRVSGSRSDTKSPRLVDAQNSRADRSDEDDQPHHGDAKQKFSPAEEDANQPPQTIGRAWRTKDPGHSTVRATKIGRGTLLNGPVRRGVIRRHSDDEDGQEIFRESMNYSPEPQQGRRREPELDNNDDLLIDYESPQPRKRTSPPSHGREDILQRQPSPEAKPPVRMVSPPHPVSFSASIGRPQPTPAAGGASVSSRSSSLKRPMFRIPSLPPAESANDQENEPPPTFRRAKPTPAEIAVHEDPTVPDEKALQPTGRPESPPKQPLAVRQSNTPHRPAPAPPPKMSLIEAVTSTAGNSRAKKSVHYVLNGRTYRRLDPIGSGGSSRVFRIMAENYKIFALKRVNLKVADIAAIAGYKGEIELLRKLGNVERVVRLFDYEINDEKGVLSVIMELGETDFSKMLNEKLKNENSKLDITFTRYYWKEMLECVQAIHEYDIVHSDLKPANFLLVKGQLKLIDFGIANAIQDDTVNVHRETQIGTPNYMSPESLVCQAPVAGQAAGTKILKLGKPSDVWSLGCILYQMTYGRPPFAHLKKGFEQIMAIPNPKVEIQFPSTGIGGAVVPFGLIKTLKRCLQRDQTLRPTIRELLSDSDPFLNPVAISPDMLGRVIGNVVSYCRKQEDKLRQSGQLGQDGVSCLPRDEDMRGWPLAFYEKLKQAHAEGTAW